jgi:hypothetical protein
MLEPTLSATISCGVGAQFEDLETFCMFIGCPRSGHSLVSSLLDAHPNMIIAQKPDALKYVKKGFSKEQICYLLLEDSKGSARNGRGTWLFKQPRRLNPVPISKYSYEVPNQWQGKCQELRVIGYSAVGTSTQRFRKHPELLQSLRRAFELKIRFVHVVRNPYDNISTISKRKELNLEDSIQLYFSFCETIESLKKQIATDELFEPNHELFLQDPQASLKELCHFLNESASDDYLRDCARIVHKSPHQSRHDAQWDHRLINIVRDRIAEFDFLKGYAFDS